MKKILLTLLLGTCLMACSNQSTDEENKDKGPKTGTSYCTRTSQDIKFTAKNEHTFEYQDDIITKQTVVVTSTFEDEAWVKNGVFTQDTLKLFNLQFQATKTRAESYPGVKYEAKTEENRSIETYTIDLTVASIEDLTNLGLYPLNDANIDYKNINETLTDFTSRFYTCNN